jgi:hypothetical protein
MGGLDIQIGVRRDTAGQGRVPPIPLLYEFADQGREYSAALLAQP